MMGRPQNPILIIEARHEVVIRFSVELYAGQPCHSYTTLAACTTAIYRDHKPPDPFGRSGILLQGSDMWACDLQLKVAGCKSYSGPGF